jgi:hypothetical protein
LSSNFLLLSKKRLNLALNVRVLEELIPLSLIKDKILIDIT